MKSFHTTAQPRPASIDVEAELVRKISAHTLKAHPFTEGPQATEIAGLQLSRRIKPTPCCHATYEPSLAVFAQGKKRINLAGTQFLCGPSSFLLCSIDVPVESQIIEASDAVPMLSLLLRLEIPIVREILSREDLPETVAVPHQRALAVGQAPDGLLAACVRLIDLLATPEDVPFLSPLLVREIIYRLLRTPQGARLRAIATTGDLGNRTARAIAWLKTNYAKRLHMTELAEVARMGVSTLHHQFRALTAMSPLQYQKQLRLQAARRRMLVEGIDASSAAFEVGYESVSQFSREYSRFFGQPPMRDIKTLRASIAV
ncbi:MAG TPA: AraC family transcriptional regulator [Candidatus Sulfotelmatobacter sp.]|nr:AraC family transcriptional regulator [Candidatus Sulfotelmatobacter sp.]